MLEILTGIVAGIVSGTGMGGGTILILVLSFFMDIEQHTAQATNLVFFVPTAIVAIFVCWKEKIIDIKVGTPIILLGMLGAVIGAISANKIEQNWLKKFFGIFLLLIAIYEIYSLGKQYILKKKKT